jgi:hypothetical protein
MKDDTDTSTPDMLTGASSGRIYLPAWLRPSRVRLVTETDATGASVTRRVVEYADAHGKFPTP